MTTTAKMTQTDATETYVRGVHTAASGDEPGDDFARARALLGIPDDLFSKDVQTVQLVNGWRRTAAELKGKAEAADERMAEIVNEIKRHQTAVNNLHGEQGALREAQQRYRSISSRLQQAEAEHGRLFKGAQK